jgi:hypothetical protein
MRLVAPIALATLCACAAARPPAGFADAPADLGQPDEARREQNRLDVEQLMQRARQLEAARKPVDSAPATATPTPDRSPLIDDLGPGRIARTTVLAFHALGPGYLLRSLELEPSRQGSGVAGFRIVSIRDGAAFLTAAGLQAGDVIRRVNGREVSEPDGFFQAWNALPVATAIDLELTRGSRPLSLRWQIVDVTADAPPVPTPGTGSPP